MPAPLPPGCNPDCPGCAHRGWGRAASEEQKTAWLRRRLAPWAERLAPLCGVDEETERWGYRDRATLSAEWDGRAWRLGLMRRDGLIAIPDCPVHSRRVRRTIRCLSLALPPADALPLLFFVQSGAQLALVVKRATPPDVGWMTPHLERALRAAGVEGMWLHCFPSAGRRKLFTKRGWHLLWGEPRSRDGSGLWHGPAAFQQLLPTLYRTALDEAERFFDPQPGDQLIDLYCGGGSSLARWCRHGTRCIGVELAGEALACAALNAPGAERLRGSCETRLPQLRQWPEAERRRLLYLNPPRTGLEAAVTAWAAREYRPERIAYLSCSAGTLARDLEQFEAAGFRVERITPYDFFPQTYHVETLALLKRD
ncbi:class I SAM-dependent RNA methyltransferase [Endothiovibrio diazotrophicus]